MSGSVSTQHEQQAADVGSDREVAPARGIPNGLAAQALAGRMSPDAVTWLQRSAGNAAVTRMLARRQCNVPTAADSHLAAIQTRIAHNAMSRLDDPDAARLEADARGKAAIGKSGLAWCGFFAELAYMSQGFDPAVLPASFDSTLKAYSFFNYLYNAFGTYPKKYIRDDNGEWQQVDKYHAQRGSKRCWIRTADLSQGELDIRPGDIATLSVPINKQKEKVEGDHVVLVQSYDKATGRLFTIGGNDGGYVVRNGAPPAKESDADRTAREAMEAATGRDLKKGPPGGHVGVGFQDLRNQRVNKLGTLVTHTHVAGIGRPSIVDFERHEYTNTPKGKVPKPSPPRPQPPSDGGGGVITLPEITIVGDPKPAAPPDNGGGGVITLPEITIVGDPTPAPKPPAPAPTPAPTPSGSGWVQGTWSTPDFKGEQEATTNKFNKRELYDEIGKVAPGLSHDLKVCLVGHAWSEQNAMKGVLNWNFAGLEGSWSEAYVMGWTSDIIPTSKYENEPDKTKYRDWDSKNHNPKYGAIDGHHAGTIDYQLALNPKPSRIAVLVKKRRPAFQSLAHGSASFVKQIERRVEALRASKDPAHNDLAERAFTGDVEAYVKIVNSSFKITDAKGKKRDFGAYNGDKGYATLVKAQIAAAKKDLPGG